MSNSFYYFFSATPQVLATITGLFGVIVIFQIQKIRRNMFGRAQGIINMLKNDVKEKVCDFNSNEEIIRELEIGILQDELITINHYLNDIKKSVNTHLDYSILVYDSYKNYLKNIIKNAINSTLISIITIVCALILIPFGEIIINNPFIIVMSFSIISILIVVCCIFYYLLFKKCLFITELDFSFQRKSNEKKIITMADVEIDGKIYH